MKHFPHRWINLACCLFLIVTLSPSLITSQRPASGPWYVATTGNDAATCTSPATACATLNAALGKASVDDMVYVAAGTYTGSGAEVVLINKSIVLSGGWNSQFDAHTGRSIIDGGGQRRGITINEGQTASIDHFTLQHGSADRGGGLHNSGSVTITAALITHNTARENMGGGGIYSTGKLWLRQSAVIENSSQVRGGGISIPGGFSPSTGATTFIENTTIARNTANYGGGVYHYPFDDLTVLNSTITGNQAEDFGGGIVDDYGGMKLRNSIVSGNSDTSGNPDCYAALPATSLGHNLIQNKAGCWINTAAGDLSNIDPKLIPMGEYYALDPHSPALDAGDPAGCVDYAGSALLIDQRGTPRPLDGTADSVVMCDMGAYEYDPDHPVYQVFLPGVRLPIQGIYGRVTQNQIPAPGIAVDLRFYNGSSWSTAASAVSAADGTYRFMFPPSLAPGQFYYVRYLNTTTPGRLFTWHTPSIGNYVQGAPVSLNDFDIADVSLVQPAPGAQVPLPQTFQWTLRPTTPNDSYEFEIFDPYNGTPYFYTGPLGYANSFTINTLPTGLSLFVNYGWDVLIYSPDGGLGSSYYARLIKFISAGTALDQAMDRFEQQRPIAPPDREPIRDGGPVDMNR